MEKIVKVRNVETGEILTYCGPTPEQAVRLAYNNYTLHISRTHDLKGPAPKRAKYGWVLGDWWAKGE